jgi:hypothetical protein
VLSQTLLLLQVLWLLVCVGCCTSGIANPCLLRRLPQELPVLLLLLLLLLLLSVVCLLLLLLVTCWLWL